MARRRCPGRRSSSTSSLDPSATDVNLHITGLAGDVCTISIAKSRSIADLKRSVSSTAGVPCNEQHLLFSSRELSDTENIGKIFEGVAGELSLLRIPNKDYWSHRLRRDGLSLRHAPESIRADRELVKIAIEKSPAALSSASEEVRGDRSVVREAVRRSWATLKYATPELRADREVVTLAIRQDGRALEFAALELRGDRGLVCLALEQSWIAFRHAAPELQEDADIAALAVRSGMPLLQAPAFLRTNRAVLAASFLRDGNRLHVATDEDKEDWDLVAAAVMQSGKALKYAAPALRANRELVRLALQQDGAALEYAAPALRADRELVALAVQHANEAQRDVVDEIYHDGIITVAMNSRSALRFAAENLRSDRELVLFAVERNGRALQYASAQLQADRDLVLSAVSHNWAALRHASSELKGDREVVTEALRQDRRALRYAAKTVQRQLGDPAAEARDFGVRRRRGSSNGRVVASKENVGSNKIKCTDGPTTIPLTDLARQIDDAKDSGRTVLVLACGCSEVETYFGYDMSVPIDCKQLLGDVFINKTKSKQQAQVELREALTEAHNYHTFCKPVHLRMANVAFDWIDFCCEDFPMEVFSGKRWTIEEAFSRNFIDETQRFNLELDSSKFKDFAIIMTSTFDLDDANSFLSDKIPFFRELAILVVDPTSSGACI